MKKPQGGQKPQEVTERLCPCEVTETWIPVEWGNWELVGRPLAPPTGTPLPPSDRPPMHRWRRRVRYHLHIEGTRRDCSPVRDTGRRVLHEIIDLRVGLEAAPTAMPPIFKINCSDCAPLEEDAENKYYCLPRVQRVETRVQSNEGSSGVPTSGAPGAWGLVTYDALAVSAQEVVEIIQEDGVRIIGGPPIQD
jgi:hypothetical protein